MHLHLRAPDGKGSGPLQLWRRSLRRRVVGWISILKDATRSSGAPSLVEASREVLPSSSCQDFVYDPTLDETVWRKSAGAM